MSNIIGLCYSCPYLPRDPLQENTRILYGGLGLTRLDRMVESHGYPAMENII